MPSHLILVIGSNDIPDSRMSRFLGVTLYPKIDYKAICNSLPDRQVNNSIIL